MSLFPVPPRLAHFETTTEVGVELNENSSGLENFQGSRLNRDKPSAKDEGQRGKHYPSIKAGQHCSRGDSSPEEWYKQPKGLNLKAGCPGTLTTGQVTPTCQASVAKDKWTQASFCV